MRYFEEAGEEVVRHNKGGSYTAIEWDIKPIFAERGKLDAPDAAAMSAPGAVLNWSARISAAGPCSLVTEHRRILWETRVWVSSLGDDFDEHHDFVVFPLHNPDLDG